MKSKFIFFLILCIFCDQKYAYPNNVQTFKFDTKNIQILNKGNLVKSGQGIAYTNNGDMEINADNFEYVKDKDNLRSYGNGLIKIKSKNLEIKFQKSIFDKKNSIIELENKIEIFNTKEKFIIKSEKILFSENKNLIESDEQTFIEDRFNNFYKVDNFEYDLETNILKAKNILFKDDYGHNFISSLAYLNLKSGKIFAKDVNLTLNNQNSKNQNEPRLKSNSLVSDNKNTELIKGIFTNCKKRDGCPPWQISAKKIEHKKKEQTIYYNDAVLKIYDVPIIYFPKFFHPDPTVKRRSGFLTPSIKSSQNSGDYLNIPYFFAIADNKDATFLPRFYSNNKILLQTEYRQVNKESEHLSDFSFLAEKKLSSKNHFFYDYKRKFKFDEFDGGLLNFKIQNTSNNTYIRKNKLKSEIINDSEVLENSLKINLYSNEYNIDADAIMYENLNSDESDKYEYILPRVNIQKNFNNYDNLNGNLSLISNNLIRHYETNVYEASNVNDLIFLSESLSNNFGFNNNYEYLIKNSNTNSKNSINYKNKENLYLSGVFQYNSTLPLIKRGNKFQKILEPKLSIRMSPNYTKDSRNTISRINADNIYSLKRNEIDGTIEGGLSFIYGSDYSVYNLSKSREVFSLKLANNFRLEENEDLPNNNQIGDTMSNIFGNLSFSLNENLNLSYNAAIKNNLRENSYESLTSTIKINNLVTTFDYLNENFDKNDSFISGEAKYMLGNNNNLAFSTRENKTLGITEYYNLIYQYVNDCLTASLEYNKQFYSDRDIKPDESILFKLTIIPFGEVNTPNLKN
jgi:LPS-assembly protein